MLFCAKMCLVLLPEGCLLKNSIMRNFLMYGWMKLETSWGLCGVMLYFRPLLSSCVAVGFRGVEDRLTMYVGFFVRVSGGIAVFPWHMLWMRLWLLP